MTEIEASYILRDTCAKVVDEEADKQKYFDALWMACQKLNPDIKPLHEESREYWETH